MRAVATHEELLSFRTGLDDVHVSESLRRYALDLTRATRRQPEVFLGASPRAGLALLRMAQARALLRGRDHVLPDDVKELVPQVFGHRILLTDQAEMDGVTPLQVLERVLAQVPVLPQGSRS